MVFDKVKDIIVSQLEIDAEKVTPDASFIEDLGADSLDVVELITAFELEFDVEIDEDKLESIKTVQDVVDYFESI